MSKKNKDILDIFYYNDLKDLVNNTCKLDYLVFSDASSPRVHSQFLCAIIMRDNHFPCAIIM